MSNPQTTKSEVCPYCGIVHTWADEIMGKKLLSVPAPMPLWGINKLDYMAAFIPSGIVIAIIIAVCFFEWRPHVFGF